MINVKNLKKDRLGSPPETKEIKNNLEIPENTYIDGRSLRKTNRTHQLSTRVTPEFYDRVRMIAARDRMKIVEVLENSIDLYEKRKK